MRDFDREWRKLERREMWRDLWGPLAVMTISSVIFGMLAYYSVFGKILFATLSAMGLPLMLWMGKRR